MGHAFGTLRHAFRGKRDVTNFDLTVKQLRDGVCIALITRGCIHGSYEHMMGSGIFNILLVTDRSRW